MEKQKTAAERAKDKTVDLLLNIGGIAALIGGAYFARKKGLGFGATFGISLLAASPFIVTRIIRINKSSVSMQEQSKKDFEKMRQQVMSEYNLV